MSIDASEMDQNELKIGRLNRVKWRTVCKARHDNALSSLAPIHWQMVYWLKLIQEFIHFTAFSKSLTFPRGAPAVLSGNQEWDWHLGARSPVNYFMKCCIWAEDRLWCQTFREMHATLFRWKDHLQDNLQTVLKYQSITRIEEHRWQHLNVELLHKYTYRKGHGPWVDEIDLCMSQTLWAPWETWSTELLCMYAACRCTHHRAKLEGFSCYNFHINWMLGVQGFVEGQCNGFKSILI